MAVVSMPETAVHRDYRFMFWKNDIRLAGQIAVVDSKAEASAMKFRTDQTLGPGVLAANAAHHAGPGLLVYDIDHKTGSVFCLLGLSIVQKIFK